MALIDLKITYDKEPLVKAKFEKIEDLEKIFNMIKLKLK